MTDYDDIFVTLERKNEWEMAAQLKALPLGERPTFLLNLYRQTVATMIDARRYTTEWNAADEKLVRLAELIMRAVSDKLMVPFTSEPIGGRQKSRYAVGALYFKHGTHVERSIAEKRVPAVQAMIAMRAYRSLVSRGKGYVREIDQADIHLHDSDVPVFEKTREYLLEIIATHWAKGEARTSRAAMEFLLRVLSKHAVEAIREADKDASRERIEEAYAHTFTVKDIDRNQWRPYQSVRRVLAKGWARKLKDEDADFIIRVGSLVKHRSSGRAKEKILAYAAKVGVLDQVGQSFINHFFWKDDWTIADIDVKKHTVVLHIPYQSFMRLGISEEGAKRALDDKAAAWQKPESWVTIIVRVIKKEKGATTEIYLERRV